MPRQPVSLELVYQVARIIERHHLQGVPERPYLERWSAVLGVTDRLRRFLEARE
jgi:hypothetical protein